MIREWKFRRVASGAEETVAINTDPVAIKGPEDITNLVQYGIPEDEPISVGYWGPFEFPDATDPVVLWGMVNYALDTLVSVNEIEVLERPDPVFDEPLPLDVIV